MASDPDLICQPGPEPDIKTRLSPTTFPTTLSLPFVPFPSSPSCTASLVPQTAPSSTDSLSGPWSPQNRYDAASGENVAARRLALIRSTPLQHCLVDRPTCASNLDNDADEAPGDLVMRRPQMHDHCYPSLKPRPPIHHTSSRLLHSQQGCVSTLTACVTTTSPLPPPFANLHHGWFCREREVETGAGYAATRPMEKMPHRGGDTRVQPHTMERRAGSCFGRHPPSDFKLS
jgi:hypothetical protein